MSADTFWQAAKTHALNKADPPLQTQLQTLFAAVEVWKKIVLNPLSHAAGAPVTRHEVQSAIDAVHNLRFK